VRQLIEDSGLKTIVFQPFRDFEGMPEPQRAKVFSRAERKFDLMQELGCDLLMICSNVSPESLGGIDRAAGDLHELGDRAAKRSMRIAFEALAWGRHINDYRDAWEAVRRADHPAVGLVLDSFHVLAKNTDLKTIRSVPRDRIFLVQIADAPKLDMDYLSWSRHFRCFPGQGDLPLLPFMEALRATDFDGHLSLEIFNDQFRAGSARRVAIDGQRSLLYMLDQMRAKTRTYPRSRHAPTVTASSSSSSRSTRGLPLISRTSLRAWDLTRRAFTNPRWLRAGAKAASISSSIAKRKGSRTPTTSRMGLRYAPLA
jgi:4-hydroxyphenylpyruvate dioxygenase